MTRARRVCLGGAYCAAAVAVTLVGVATVAVPASAAVAARSAHTTTGARVARKSGGGSITVRVRALPRGLRAAATIRGPAGLLAIERTTTLRHLRAGTYTLSARVVSGKTDVYHPTIGTCVELTPCQAVSRGRVVLKRGAHLTLYVTYQDVVAKTTKVLGPTSLRRLTGDLRASGQLVFGGTAALGFGPGSVIVGAPSQKLPYGLLRKVSHVTVSGSQTLVSTVAATLIEAVPRGTLAFTTTAASSSSPPQAHTASVGALSLALPGTPVSCSSATAVSLSAELDVQPPQISFSAEWGQGGPPTASLSGTLAATVTSSFSAAHSFICSASTDFPTSPATGVLLPEIRALVGGVPVWVTPELVGTASVSGQAEEALSQSTTNTASVTAGLAYTNGHFQPTLSATHATTTSSSSPGTSGQVEVAAGLKVYLDFFKQRQFACLVLGNCADVLGVPYLAATVGPTLTIQRSLEPWWRLDANFKLTAALAVPQLGLDASQTFQLAQFAISAPPGRPREVTATPESEGATISWKAPPPNPAEPILVGEVPCACQPVSGYTVFLNGEEKAVPDGATSLTLTGLRGGVTYHATVVADGQAGSANDSLPTEAVTFTVGPTITTKTLGDGVANTPYSETLKATGGEQPYSWAVTSGALPAGLALDLASGVISGTPTAPGESNVAISVTDKFGASDTASYTLAVTAADTNPAKITLEPANAEIPAGQTVAYTVTGWDSAGDPTGTLNHLVHLSVAPDGECNDATDACTVKTAGPHTVTVQSGTVSGSTGLQIVAGPLATLELAPASKTIAAGGEQTYEVKGFDAYHNPRGPVTNAILSLEPLGGGCVGYVCTAPAVTSSTQYVVRATAAEATGTAMLEAAPVVHMTLTPHEASVDAGEAQAYKAEGYDAANLDLGDITKQTTLSISPDGSCDNVAHTCTPAVPRRPHSDRARRSRVGNRDPDRHRPCDHHADSGESCREHPVHGDVRGDRGRSALHLGSHLGEPATRPRTGPGNGSDIRDSDPARRKRRRNHGEGRPWLHRDGLLLPVREGRRHARDRPQRI